MLKKIFSNKNIWCFIFIFFLINIHSRLTKMDSFILDTIKNRFDYTTTFEIGLLNTIDVRYCIIIFIIICVICILYPNNMKLMLRNVEITKLNKCLVLPIIVLYTSYIAFLGLHNLDIKLDYIKKINTYPMIIDITLDELENIENFDTALIYIEREGCSSCEKITPIIEYISADYNIPIYKYNTIQDRDNDKERMSLVLEKLNIDSVPILVIICDNKIETILKGEEINVVKETIQQYLKRYNNE